MGRTRVTNLRGTRGRAAALLTAAALPAVAACGGDAPQGTTVTAPSDAETSFLDDPCQRQGGERRKFFQVGDHGFAPKRVVLRSATPVTFVNCGKRPHTVTQAAGPGKDFDSGVLRPHRTFGRTFIAIGTHRIVDRRHPGSEMVLEVTGLPGQPQAGVTTP